MFFPDHHNTHLKKYHAPYTKTSNDKNVARFWDRYLEKLREHGVKQAAMRWYVVRAEEYIRAAEGKKLAAQEVADITRYLEKMGRKGGISDWQFRQIVDAIQILLQTANVACVSQVNWE
ncbi:MAG: hypothetical protein ACPL7J_08950 [Desulfomonilaceae bacterium]